MTGHKYTPEQDAWLREHAQLSRAELTTRFNEVHGTALTQMAIRRYCIRHRILTGRTGRFEDGNRSWQTGLRGEDYWAHFTPETRAAAIECITPKPVYADGEVVTFPSQNGKRRLCTTAADGSREYRCMTGIIWEAAHGPLPKGYRLIHLDGNETNDDIDNIRAIPQSWMSIIASFGGLSENREINEAKLAYCAVFSAIRHGHKRKESERGADNGNG